MTVFEGFILGLIQGLTEFLPISSSGHLVFFQKLLKVSEEQIMTFDIVVHFATLVGVFAILKNDILEILKKPFGKLPLLIVVGTIPTGLIALAFGDIFENLLKTGKSIGFEFIFTGLVLLLAERIKSKEKGLKEATFVDAAVIGIAQGIAILPAVSRSGLTLAGGLMRGLNREFAIKLSFLMSIPAILLGTGKQGYDSFIKSGSSATANIDVLPMVVGSLAAAVAGYFAVKFMLKIFTRMSLNVFAYYTIVLGLLILSDQLFFKVFFTGLL